jgi:hypothetical protein
MYHKQKVLMKYDNETCNQFVADMEEAGYEVQDYQGRFYWTGPAVRVRDPGEYQDIVRSTDVRLQYDQLGLGLVIYPVASGKLVQDISPEVKNSLSEAATPEDGDHERPSSSSYTPEKR